MCVCVCVCVCVHVFVFVWEFVHFCFLDLVSFAECLPGPPFEGHMMIVHKGLVRADVSDENQLHNSHSLMAKPVVLPCRIGVPALHSTSALRAIR